MNWLINQYEKAYLGKLRSIEISDSILRDANNTETKIKALIKREGYKILAKDAELKYREEILKHGISEWAKSIIHANKNIGQLETLKKELNRITRHGTADKCALHKYARKEYDRQVKSKDESNEYDNSNNRKKYIKFIQGIGLPGPLRKSRKPYCEQHINLIEEILRQIKAQ